MCWGRRSWPGRNRYQQAQQAGQRGCISCKPDSAAAEERAVQATARAELEERAHQEAQAHAESEKSNSRRLRWLLGLIVVLFFTLLTTGGLAMFAWSVQKMAAEQQRVAETQPRHAGSGELAVQAITAIQSDPELGILLALEAISTTQTAPAEDALRRSLLASYVTASLPHEQPVMDAKFSPDGKGIVSAPWGEQIRIWDTSTYQALGYLHGYYSPTVKLASESHGQSDCLRAC